MKKVIVLFVFAIVSYAKAQDATVGAPSTDSSVVEMDSALDPNSLPQDPAIPAVATLVPPPVSTDQAAVTENSQSQALQQAETNTSSSPINKGN